LFSRVLLFITLPPDSTVESKVNVKTDVEAKKSLKVMTLDGQINIANKLRGGMCAAAGGQV
jgi:hypothetical protein